MPVSRKRQKGPLGPGKRKTYAALKELQRWKLRGCSDLYWPGIFKSFLGGVPARFEKETGSKLEIRSERKIRRDTSRKNKKEKKRG